MPSHKIFYFLGIVPSVYLVLNQVHILFYFFGGVESEEVGELKRTEGSNLSNISLVDPLNILLGVIKDYAKQSKCYFPA